MSMGHSDPKTRGAFRTRRIKLFSGSTKNMTIKIEHDALLQVAQQQHQQQITQRRPQQDCCVIEDCFALERRLSFEFDDDTASVLTNSTASSDIRSVSFADTLVSDVWTRPYTPVDEIPRLFYHAEEIARYVRLCDFFGLQNAECATH